MVRLCFVLEMYRQSFRLPVSGTNFKKRVILSTLFVIVGDKMCSYAAHYIKNVLNNIDFIQEISKIIFLLKENNIILSIKQKTTNFVQLKGD